MNQNVTQEIVAQVTQTMNNLPKIGSILDVIIILLIMLATILFIFILTSLCMFDYDFSATLVALIPLGIAVVIYIFGRISFNVSIKNPLLNSISASKYTVTVPIGKVSKDYILNGNPINIEDTDLQSLLKSDTISTSDAEVYVPSIIKATDNDVPTAELEITKISYSQSVLDEYLNRLADLNEQEYSQKLDEVLRHTKDGISYKLKSINYSNSEDALKSTYTKTAIPTCSISLDIQDAIIPTDLGSISLADIPLIKEVSDTAKLELTYGDPHLSENEAVSPSQITVGRYLYDLKSVKLYAPQHTTNSSQFQTDVKVDVDVNMSTNGTTLTNIQS